MGKGFGRGAKSVAIVTHAQVKHTKKKLPKGLRGGRKKKRRMFHAANDEQQQLEQSLGVGDGRPQVQRKDGDGSVAQSAGGGAGRKSLAQQIAGIQFQHVLNKRQKGFKSLRKQLLASVKDVRRRHAEKGKRRNAKDEELLAERFRSEQRKARKVSGNTRRSGGVDEVSK